MIRVPSASTLSPIYPLATKKFRKRGKFVSGLLRSPLKKRTDTTKKKKKKRNNTYDGNMQIMEKYTIDFLYI